MVCTTNSSVAALTTVCTVVSAIYTVIIINKSVFMVRCMHTYRLTDYRHDRNTTCLCEACSN